MAKHLTITHFPELDYVSAEGMNTLVTNLSYCGQDVKRIMVTSRYAGEGKSFITMNLMRTYALMGRKVIVVDTDLRASGIQLDYHLRTKHDEILGLSEYLSGKCAFEDIVYQTNVSGAYIIPAGHEAPNPLQLLDTPRMKQLMDAVSREFDLVLVDTAPVGMLVDAIAIAKFCDGALLVVSYGQGKQKEIGEAVEHIKQTGCKMLGAVMNEVRFKKLSNKHYYYSSRRYSGYYRKRYGKRPR